MEYSVEVINLSKSYGKKDAVRGIDFKIKEKIPFFIESTTSKKIEI